MTQLIFDRTTETVSTQNVSIVFKPSQPHSHLSLSQKKSKNEMTNLCSRLTERCVISFNLPYSSTTLPAGQVDLVNVYWYPVIKFQMNGTNLKRIKNISGLFVSWLWHSWNLNALLVHFLPKMRLWYLNRVSFTHIPYQGEFLNFADYVKSAYKKQG